MFLERLVINGFKSFANKTELVFPKPIGKKRGIAAIVGPNGSGKSNVADAIRWVLGEQSLKLLRGKKSDDVIFSGSDKRARLGMAEASLHINNEDGSFPLDYKEAIITRRLHRNSDGEYILNKNQIRLNEILILMAKANFGQKSYSVIGQGMVDSFLNSTPQERKEYFDEAVGVRQYQIKREQSARKLERTWENLKQAEAILDEIRPRLQSLTRQVKRLEKRKEVERDLKDVQMKYFGIHWTELSTQEKLLRPNEQKIKAEVERWESELSAIQKQLDALEKQDTRTEEFNKLQRSYQEVLNKKNVWQEKHILTKNRIELARQKALLQVAPITTKEIIEQLEGIENLDQELSKYFSLAKDFSDIGKIRELFSRLSKKIRELVTGLKHPEKKKDGEIAVDEKLLEELDLADKEFKKYTAEVEKKYQEILDFNKRQDQQKGKFFELQRSFQEKQRHYHEASQKYNDIRIEKAKLQTRKEDLEKEITKELGDTNWLSEYTLSGQTNMEFLSAEMVRLKRQLELIGGIDPEVVEEYGKIKERHDFLEKQTTDLRASIESLKKVIEDLDETIHKQFDETFKHISTDFQKYFKILFHGGKSELILIKEDSKELEEEKKFEAAIEGVDIESVQEVKEDEELKKLFRGKNQKVIRGIEISATPPGKRLKNISMLSGGERALTSIALICAIISNNPSPFVVLDEVDAALDEANSDRFASIIDELSHKTQFIVITHNRATMHKANILYGVTMGDDGVSKLLSLKLEEAEKQVRT